MIVPSPSAELWPTLGPEVCDWIEDNLVYGPGDKLGESIALSNEMRGVIYRAYEVFPRDHSRQGRRRFRRVVLSRRKGWAKTELAAWLAIAEMDSRAPVRCDGWRILAGEWVPVGSPVHDPYIPMCAVTEEQTEDLAYAAAREIVSRSALDGYDVGLDRIVHRSEPGKIQPLASAPGAREGARTTFQHFDETHLFTLPRLKRAHATMLRNLAKRREADPWSLETTTAHAPGEESVAELSQRHAEDVRAGRVEDSGLYYDHLQASEQHDLTTRQGLRAAIRAASGDAWAWADVAAIEAQYHDPQVSEEDFRRYWLNQPRRRSLHWIDVGRLWDPLFAIREVAPGARIVLGFDGSYSRDSTALVGCTVEERPHLFVVAMWERPAARAGAGWRVPRGEVNGVIAATMERWQVLELACDPPGWHSEIEGWESVYGNTVVRFDTARISRMGPACDAFFQAVADGRLSHDGHTVLRQHLASCVPMRRGRRVVVAKDEDLSERIDAAVAAIIAFDRARWRYRNERITPQPWAVFA